MEFMPEDFSRAMLDSVDRYLFKYQKALEKFVMHKVKNNKKIDTSHVEDGFKQLSRRLNLMVDEYLGDNYRKEIENLLEIPPELLEEGWFRLEHQENVDFTIEDPSSVSAQLSDQLTTLQLQLYREAWSALQKKRKITKRKRALEFLRDVQTTIENSAAGLELHQNNGDILRVIQLVNQIFNRLDELNIPLPSSLEPSQREMYTERLVRNAVERTRASSQSTWSITSQHVAGANALHQALSSSH